MRAASLLGPVFAILTATACSTVHTVSTRQPAPEPEPWRTPARASSTSASTAATLGIPPGHLPPPGLCKIWIPGNPPGRQAKARNCNNIERAAPAGSWILYRPSEDRKVVRVQVVDSRRTGVIVHRRIYDVARGTLISES